MVDTETKYSSFKEFFSKNCALNFDLSPNKFTEDEQKLDLKALGKFLDEQGIKEFKFLDGGTYATVLDIGNEQVLRFVAIIDEEERVNIPQVLQPIFSAKVGGYRVEILPKLNTKDVTQHHLIQLEEVFLNSSHSVAEYEDSLEDEVGLLFDGTPVVIDGGSVVRNPKTPESAPKLEDNPIWKGKQEEHIKQKKIPVGNFTNKLSEEKVSKETSPDTKIIS